MAFSSLFACGILSVLGYASSIPAQNDSKVIGGSPAFITEHPYFVAVEERGRLICSGSLIKNDVVLTTAGCCHRVTADRLTDMKLRAGTHESEFGGQVRSIIKIMAHPSYGSALVSALHAQNRDYDVGLLQADSEFRLDVTTRVIGLPFLSDNRPTQDVPLFVTGMGQTAPEGKTPNTKHLSAATVYKIQNSICQGFWANATLTDRMMCAKAADAGACYGDEGSPLVMGGINENPVQVGITSIPSCGVHGAPGIFTNLYHISINDFVRKHVNLWKPLVNDI